mgnify:FL=1
MGYLYIFTCYLPLKKVYDREVLSTGNNNEEINMEKPTVKVINECAGNLMFKLSQGQDVLIAEEFDTIIDQMEFLKGIPGVDDAEPMTFPYKMHQKDKDLRVDVPEAPIGEEATLMNSNAKLGKQIKVPRVVAHGEKNGEDEGV